ncbi:hypothetical protein [Tropicimonas sp. IMCC34043]|uniref:hypothetical protein n=1 Tax=Tropicimonas sp. IMCC34043 TaxID=2248760 RepID=UPI001300A68E|nr:hypothetical protein [Tropicimonas sp. IMCC34043]
MRKFFVFKQNDIDPNPEVLEGIRRALDFVFKFAEYALVTGVFIFLAITTSNWAVGLIAVILFFLLYSYLVALLTGFQFFFWRSAGSWWTKTLLFVLDSSLYVFLFLTLLAAMYAVIKAMAEGVGI